MTTQAKALEQSRWLLNKVMRIGTINTGRGRYASIYVRAEITDGKLSISGVIGPMQGGNALGGCGQIDMEFAHRNKADNDYRYDHPIHPSQIRFAPGWNTHDWFDLLDIWKRWHMNDTRAGSPKQEQYLREHPIDPKEYAYPKSHHEVAAKVLADAGLNPDTSYKITANANDAVSRIDNGYMYGSGWTREELPDSVIERLAGFPDADKKPAWV